MRDKTIDSGAYVHMSGRVCRIDFLCDKQILMEIMPRGRAAFIIFILKTGIKFPKEEFPS